MPQAQTVTLILVVDNYQDEIISLSCRMQTYTIWYVTEISNFPGGASGIKGLLEIEITKHLAGWQIVQGCLVGGIASRRTRMALHQRASISQFSVIPRLFHE